MLVIHDRFRKKRQSRFYRFKIMSLNVRLLCISDRCNNIMLQIVSDKIPLFAKWSYTTEQHAEKYRNVFYLQIQFIAFYSN